jgi:hypothetical protein
MAFFDFFRAFQKSYLTDTSGNVTLNVVKGLSGGAVREILHYVQNDIPRRLLKDPDARLVTVAKLR